MEIGVGLPTNLEGVSAREVIDWAVRAEGLGFSTLAATDRLAASTWDPIVALATVAGVTSRCRLMTNVVVVPNRGSAGQLAKQLMTLDRAADGRFVAGVGIGDRADDYEVAAQEMAGRHDRFDTMIEDVQRVLTAATPALEKVGPRQGHGRPPLLVGGRSEATFERAARYGIGWTVSISHPDQVRDGVAHLRKAWGRAGRYGEPRVVALTYFGLGEEAPQKTPAYLRSYYEFIGPIADLVATSAPTNGAGIRGAIAAYADAGADELIFLPTLPGTGELELLADAAAFSLPRAASR